MPESMRMAEVKVGAFVVAALIILVVGTLWVAGTYFGGGGRVTYRVLMDNSGGVQSGDRVRFVGVVVGRVESLTLRQDRDWPVLFEISIDQNLSLKTDSSASISTAGVLGSNFLQLTPGSPDAAVLPPGGEIRGRSGPGLDEALARVDEITEKVLGLLNETVGILEGVSDQIRPIMERVELFLSAENTENLNRILTTLRDTVEASSPQVTRLLERLDVASERLAGGLEDLPEMTGQIESLTADLRAAIGPDGERLSSLLDAGESTLRSADGALGWVEANRPQLERILGSLAETVANLQAFSQEVKERPFSLVRIHPRPERRPGQGVREAGR
ncbi:MAG: MlaD family protein [Acidobacteriota bacterium]